jgi:hypothetical protein
MFVRNVQDSEIAAQIADLLIKTAGKKVKKILGKFLKK